MPVCSAVCIMRLLRFTGERNAQPRSSDSPGLLAQYPRGDLQGRQRQEHHCQYRRIQDHEHSLHTRPHAPRRKVKLPRLRRSFRAEKLRSVGPATGRRFCVPAASFAVWVHLLLYEFAEAVQRVIMVNRAFVTKSSWGVFVHLFQDRL